MIPASGAPRAATESAEHSALSLTKPCSLAPSSLAPPETPILYGCDQLRVVIRDSFHPFVISSCTAHGQDVTRPSTVPSLVQVKAFQNRLIVFIFRLFTSSLQWQLDLPESVLITIFMCLTSPCIFALQKKGRGHAK